MARAPRIPEGPPRRFGAVWRQERIPVLPRPHPEPPLYVSLPYALNNRAWLHACGRINPKKEMSKKTGKTHWEVPSAWFGKLLRRCVERYSQVYVIQPLNRAEICANSCWTAKHDICECSCFGTNHGGGKPSGAWKEISETFAVQWSGGELACRLITRPAQLAQVPHSVPLPVG